MCEALKNQEKEQSEFFRTFIIKFKINAKKKEDTLLTPKHRCGESWGPALPCPRLPGGTRYFLCQNQRKHLLRNVPACSTS